MYSPVAFLRGSKTQLASAFLKKIDSRHPQKEMHTFGESTRLYFTHLEWDTQHFGVPIYKIEFADCDFGSSNSRIALAETLRAFVRHLSAAHSKFYLFSEIPAEDIEFMQAFGLAGGALVESRLTYFRDDLQSYSWPKRYSVRCATTADVENLRTVAARTRNRFDRFHAESFFSHEVADEFLATFVENSIDGFADVVLVPADGKPPSAFLSGKKMSEISTLLGFDISRLVLSAVAAERGGWFLKLMSELSYFFKDQGASVAIVTTQATNKTVLRVLESLGYRYGRCSHIFSLHS